MPSEAQVQSAISAGVAVHELLRIVGGTSTSNVLGLIDSYVSTLGTAQGDYTGPAASGMDVVRANYAGAVDSSSAWLGALLSEYALVRGFADTDPQLILRRLYQDFIDNSKRVQSRVFSFGSVSLGGSNVGGGTVNRLTKDENSLDIENTWAQTLTMRCIRDRNSGGVKHEEVFEIRGGEANRDNILIAGSGNVSTVKCLSARDSMAYFQNPSFDLMSGSGTTKFDGWTISGAAANFDQNTNYYRDYFGAPATSYSLKQTADDTIAQAFSVNNSQFDPTVPMYVQIAWNREVGTASGGTITLTFGDQTATVSVGAGTGWQILRLGLTSKAWYKNFMGTAPTLSIGVSGLSSGYLLYDDIVVAPFQNFDGLWYAPVGNATPFIVNDTATFADTETGAKIQRWLWRTYGLYLPHSTGTPVTWADPAAPTLP